MNNEIFNTQIKDFRKALRMIGSKKTPSTIEVYALTHIENNCLGQLAYLGRRVERQGADFPDYERVTDILKNVSTKARYIIDRDQA